jgi:hypothetical protein
VQRASTRVLERIEMADGQDDVGAGQHPPDRRMAIHLAPARRGQPRVLAQRFDGQDT